MNRGSIRLVLSAAAFAFSLSSAARAPAITRTETMIRAKAFAFHPWKCTSANTKASCNPAYTSVYTPGDYMGLAYDWGGYMSLFQYDQQIAQGYGAGSYPADGILSCTAGVDCSGFVSQAWANGYYQTSNVAEVSSAISQSNMLPGDIFNDPGNHMALFSHLLANGEPVLYESVFYNVHLSMPGWSWLNGYVPRRFNKMTGTTADSPGGTPDNPVVIGSLPYTDSRNTAQSSSDLLDGCGVAPGSNESGPEYVYKVVITKPGQLTVSVQDDVGVDIDVHLYTSMNTNDCIARHDTAFTVPVDCGTYYVVADTFYSSSSGALVGPYTLNVSFQETSGKSCGSGPPGYAFKGAPGTPCAHPGDQTLPFCNPNLGADTCLYTSSSSFCSMPCGAASECSALGSGSCCADIGGGDKYCLPSSQCGSPTSDGGIHPPPDAGAGGGAGFGGGAGLGGAAGGSAGGASGFGGFAGVPAAGGAGGGSTFGGGPAVGGGSSAGVPGSNGSSSSSSGCSMPRSGGLPDARGVGLGLLALAALTRRRRCA